MREFLVAVVVTVILVVIFSYTELPEMIMPTDGIGPKYPGNSGMVLPGSGSEPARMVSQELTRSDREKGNRIQTAQEEISEEKTARPKNEMEEEKTMDEIMIAFWHGVAAVLIGETSALLTVRAWLRIKGGKDGR